MSGLLGGKRSNSVIPNMLNGIQINQSIYGKPYVLAYGQVRLSPTLLWYGDFKGTPHQQSGGGKGGGGGQTTSYTYSAAMIMGLCEGPITSAPTSYVDRASIADHTTLGWSLALGSAGQGVWSYLTTNHPTQAIGYDHTAYVFGGPFQLGSSAAVPNSSFEIVALLSNATYGGDAAPAAIIADYCTDPNHSANFNSLATLTGPNSYDTYCQAMGFFLSPVEKTQRTAADFLKEIVQITNSFAVWSGSQLKIIPYGDQAVTGNGVTWTPSNGNGGPITTPIYSFGDDDFLSADRPVIETRKPTLLTYNYYTVEFVNRSNAYNTDVATASDARDIAQNGERAASVLSFHSIKTASIARLVGQLLLQRDLYYRNTAQFKVLADYSLLEAGDVVEINDSVAGIVNKLVRIIEIQDDDNDVLTITVEDLPIGPGHAPQYSWDSAAGYSDNALVSPGSVVAPCIFTIPPLLVSGNGGYEVGIAVAGTSANWGGCDVYMSLDGGMAYQQISTIVGPGRYGTLTAAMASNATDPDTTSTLSIALADTALTIAPASQSDVDNYRTMLYVDGEIMCYRDATLVSAGNYNLGYFHRGLYGSTIASHALSAQWARIDQYLFRMPFDPGLSGQVATFKFCSFNIFGRAVESLASVTAYTHTIGNVSGPSNGTFSLAGVNVTPIGSNFIKTGGAANTWDSQIYSNEGYATAAYASAQAVDVTSTVAFGLSSDPALSVSYTAIDYCWYLAAGTAYIYQSGTLIATIGAYVAGTVFSVTWDGANVHYLMNATLEHTTAATPAKLYLDSSYYNIGGALKSIVFGPSGTVGAAGATGATGAAGLNGTRTAVLRMHQWAASTPTLFPSGTSTYTWSTGGFTAPGTLNGWSLVPPAPVPGDVLYAAEQVYADALTSSTSTVTWSTSTALPFGSPGVNGSRTAFLEMYQWAASTPTLFPSGTSTYTWATGAFTAPATPNSWTLLPGAPVAGQTLYGCGVDYSDSLTSSTSAVTWSTSTAYGLGAAGTNGTNGTNGINGTRTAVLKMYQWASSAPGTFPSGTSTYTWATGSFTAPGTPNSWTLTPGAPVLGETLYAAEAAYADSLTSSTSTVTWSASVALPFGAAGSNGSNGLNGTRTAFLEMYQWASSTPATFPSGTSTYTWATGAFTAPGTTNGWTLLPGAPVAGDTLYGCGVDYADSLTTTTSSVTWSTSTAYALGAAGTNGATGSTGAAGAPAFSVLLSASAETVFAYADGTVPSFTGINGTVRVLSGTTDVTTSATFSATAINGLTGTVNTASGTPVGGQPAGYYQATAMTNDTGGLAITASYGGNSATVNWSVTKVKTGYEIVSTLPVTYLITGRVVFLTTDNQLYRYNGSAWTTAVPAVNITGTLTSAQIASVAAASVTGTLTDAQLAAISASKVTGTLTSAQIASVAAASVTGTLTSSQIASVAAATVTGTIVSAQIAAGAVTGSQIASGAVTTSSLASTLKAIEVVSTLPAAGTAGRTVFLTTNGRIYRDNGAAWVSLGSTNLLDASTWAVGSSGSQPGFNELGLSTGGSNQILLEAAPDGWNRDIWRASSGSSAGTSSEGGWNSTYFPIDPTKTYRFTVWIRCGGGTTGSAYLGCCPGVEDIPGGGVDSNPYFDVVSRSSLVQGRWYLFVGYVLHTGYGGVQNYAGGIYDGTTGVKIANGTDFMWAAGATNTYYRSYQYYTSASGTTQDFWNPTVMLCDGTEGTVNDLLATAALSGLNPITASNYSTVISAGAINADRIAANSITAAQIAAGTITATQIAASTITSSQIAAGTIVAGDIAASTITGSNIAAGTITGSNLVAGTITAGEIASGTITATQIAAGTITGAKIAAGTIAAGNIASNTITAAQIAANTITASQIAAATITGSQIAAGTITAAEIAVTSLSAMSSNMGTITAGTIIFDNGTNMMVEGIAFGTSSNLLWWFGPHQTSIANCTKANAISYIGIDGTCVWGGSAAGTSGAGTLSTHTASATETIPSGKTSVTIELWGDTGASGIGNATIPTEGGAGASGGYTRTVLNIAGQAGNTFTVSLQAGGVTTSSAVTAGTVTGFTTMSAPGGGNGTNATSSADGKGGTAGAAASGGTVVNYGGNDGGAGAGIATGNGRGGASIPGINGSGKNGANGTFNTSTANAGQPAVALFYYT